MVRAMNRTTITATSAAITVVESVEEVVAWETWVTVAEVEVLVFWFSVTTRRGAEVAF